ncbi:MAG TPA: glutamine synthetase, partial [Clostridiaceae bacterium]|nr:glutamine synthetase [Clostridiaceae bacterium]
MQVYTRNFISPEELSKENLLSILDSHSEIRFVSVAGVDLMGHETDEKIPVAVFIEDIDRFLNGIAVHTDGSSVILPDLATINNAKIDMRADTSVKWWIDRNADNIDPVTGL